MAEKDQDEKNRIEKIRSIIDDLEEIAGRKIAKDGTQENTCWIDGGGCAYGGRGILQNTDTDWCWECHKLKDAFNSEFFQKLSDNWIDDLQETAFKEINKETVSVKRLIRDKIEKTKNLPGSPMYQVLHYFLGVLDDELDLETEVAPVEGLNELIEKFNKKPEPPVLL